jgi:predicted PurR-regulated permease PerM
VTTGVFVQRVLIALALVATAAVAVALLALFPTVPLMVFGAVLGAILLDGLARPVAARTGASRALAVGLVSLVGIAVLAGVFWLSGPRIADEGTVLSERVPEALDAIGQRFADVGWVETLWPERPGASDRKMLLDLASRMAGSMRGVFSQISFGLSGLGVVVVLAFFLAVQPRPYLQGLIRLVPPPHRERTGEVLDALTRALRWWLVGRFSAMGVVGLLTFVGLALLGIPLALVLSLVVAILSFVPYLGPVLGAVPAVAVGLVEGPLTALWIVALYTGVQLAENNLITPLIQQRAVSLPPAVLLAAQLVMGVLFGLLGLLLATPLTVSAIVLVQALYVQDVLGEPIELLGEGHGTRQGARSRGRGAHGDAAAECGSASS